WPTPPSPRSRPPVPMPGRSWWRRSPMRWPRSCSPAAPRACPRAWCTGTAISWPRRRCWASRSASGPAGWTCRPSRPSPCSTRPAQASPVKLHAAIERFGVDQLFGSPALMRVLAEYGKPLPGLKRVTSAGAPVPSQVVARMRELLPDDASFWTPYGATECLPVSVVEGAELVALRDRTAQGAGTCVGRPVPPNEVRIIRVSDDAIAEWSDALMVGGGLVGEITVAGPTTTDAYF